MSPKFYFLMTLFCGVGSPHIPLISYLDTVIEHRSLIRMISIDRDLEGVNYLSIGIDLVRVVERLRCLGASVAASPGLRRSNAGRQG